MSQNKNTKNKNTNLANKIYKNYIELYNFFMEKKYNELNSIKLVNGIILDIILLKNYPLFYKPKYINDEISSLKSFKNLKKLLINPNFNNVILGEVFEKIVNKKELGAYYTNRLATTYISKLSIYLFFIKNTYGINKIKKFSNINLNKIENIFNKAISEYPTKAVTLLKNISILDPTCGSGAFLFSALETLIDVYKKLKVKYDEISLIKKHIYGIDIDESALEMLKCRLLLYFIEKGYNLENLNMFQKNFTSKNFLTYSLEKKFDCIIGNPPFVEKKKVSYLMELNNYESIACNNLYAYVLEKSLKCLKEEGILSMVVPISFISTKRMKPIRNILKTYSDLFMISSFADRPSSLFKGVHQKINIIFLSKSKEVDRSKEIFTTQYYHWYKNEFNKLYSNINFIKHNYYFEDYIPKLGNRIELSIFSKIISNPDPLLNLTSNTGKYEVFVSTRAYMWIKTHTKKISSEYKGFKFDQYEKAIIFLSILNSSLFFFFWEKISDGWHLTNKEIQDFKINLDNLTKENKNLLVKYYLELEKDLEKNKEIINTKQSTFAYKHKKSIDIINKIDEIVFKMFNLNKREKAYILNYQKEYRI